MRCSARSTCPIASAAESPVTCTTGPSRSSPGCRCGCRRPLRARPIPRSKWCCVSRPRPFAAASERCARRSSASIRRTSRPAGWGRRSRTSRRRCLTRDSRRRWAALTPVGPAMEDLTSRLPHEGLEVSLDVADPGGYGPTVDQLLYRVCQEALRNVEKHAGAAHVAVRVGRSGSSAVLEVTDDGRGVPADAPEEGHLGLQIVDDLVRDAGGTLLVTPGSGG